MILSESRGLSPDMIWWSPASGGSAIQPKIPEMGPLSHEMALIQGQNLVVVG
jgi:hypothetical protein